MAFEHPRLAAVVQSEDARGPVPGCRGKMSAVGRNREADDRSPMRGQNSEGLASARPIDRNAAILAGGRKSASGQREDRIDRAFMDAEHRARGGGVDFPQDRGLVEASGNGMPPIR